MRVYENDALLYDWPVSTGLADSPTYTGEFQILSKEENAYASQWDLWMPHFMAVYRAGGDVYNGIHALPILSSGQRLWEGSLGSPASFGCIILGIQEAETLYNWAEVGVLVTIE
jgi:lipoprotein-anchoring transpeptidase ErfK/SrfK